MSDPTDAVRIRCPRCGKMAPFFFTEGTISKQCSCGCIFKVEFGTDTRKSFRGVTDEEDDDQKEKKSQEELAVSDELNF